MSAAILAAPPEVTVNTSGMRAMPVRTEVDVAMWRHVSELGYL